MPESYNGNEGDYALTKGFDVMDGVEDRRDGWRAINKTRDLIASLKNRFETENWPWSRISGKPTTYPPSGHTHSSISAGTGKSLGWNNDLDAWNTGNPVNFNGVVTLPNAGPATSGPVIAYIQSDGRLSKGTSSRRYKKDIVDAPELGNVFPRLREFEFKGGDGVRVIGYIAEELLKTDAARFVVYDADGNVESIDFIPLLLAQTAQIPGLIVQVAEIPELVARVAELEQRLQEVTDADA